ncbi:MAG TPA: flavodoxin family protein [Methanomicrobiales archaeon]|nr:flavodoxin family protein [Methanomicrobiales archaeon]
MARLIIYTSEHHGNTAKVARTLAEVLQADLVKTKDATPAMLQNYDLVGFGSGIYFGRHHRSLLAFMDTLPNENGKKVFIFSTSGTGRAEAHRTLREMVMAKGFLLIGQFACKGYDTFFLLRLIGGINRGRPDEQDLEDAARFAESLIHQEEVL